MSILFDVLRIFRSILLHLSNSSHPFKLLSNFIEILFQIRHSLEIECWIYKNEYVRHLFAFNHGYKAAKVHDIFLLYTDITYRLNDTEMANLSSLARVSCILWLKKNRPGKVSQKMTSSHVTATRHRHSVGEVQKHGTSHVTMESNFSALPLMDINLVREILTQHI